MKKLTKTWLIAALIRSVRTIAQTALSMISIGMAISEIDWLNVLSVSLVAGVYSILTSVATGLPESNTDGEVTVNIANGTKNYDFQLDIPTEELENRETITFIVNTKKE